MRMLLLVYRFHHPRCSFFVVAFTERGTTHIGKVSQWVVTICDPTRIYYEDLYTVRSHVNRRIIMLTAALRNLQYKATCYVQILLYTCLYRLGIITVY